MLRLALVLLLASLPLRAGEPVDLFSIDLMATSPAGDAVALAMNGSRATVLTVSWPASGTRRTASFGRDEIDAVLDAAAIAELAWSPDGRFVAIELLAREGDSAILLFDTARPATLSPVAIDGHDNLALPRWGPKGAELWAVHGEILDGPDEEETGGIFRLDVHSGRAGRILATEWVSDYRVSGSSVTALVETDEAEDGSVLGKLVRYDVRTGKRETLFQQRSAPSGRRGVISL